MKEVRVYHTTTEVAADHIMLACLVAFAIGAFTGWACRVTTTNDRVQRAAAETYLAEKYYYNKQADEIIGSGINQTPPLKVRGGREGLKNGKKEN